MIAVSRLNKCAHCGTQKNLHVAFSTDGKLYFICSAHKALLDTLVSIIERR